MIEDNLHVPKILQYVIRQQTVSIEGVLDIYSIGIPTITTSKRTFGNLFEVCCAGENEKIHQKQLHTHHIVYLKN